MFIRQTKTKNAKTGEVYVKHTLVESVRTASGPRQRTVMQLGKLSIPRKSWPVLAAELERRIAGQGELDLSSLKCSDAVARAADMAMEKFSPRVQRKVENIADERDADFATVDLNTATTSMSRSVGAELLVHDAWKLLELPKILKKLGLDKSERSLAEAVVAARMIEPGSDLKAWNWIRNASAVGELTEEPLEAAGRNRVYEIADRLCGVREQIETSLRNGFGRLFPDERRLFLFDLTNFYLEGQALGNSLAYHAKSKERRNDCRLVSLALAVDSRGFPLFSRVHPGNIGEPATLKEVLDAAGLLEGERLPGFDAPTVVMDRGIATKANIAMLKSNGLKYIVVERGARSREYLAMFENAAEDPDFTRIDRDDQPPVFVKKMEKPGSDTVEVLCVSEGKKQKERAMALRWEERACEDILKLQGSIRAGNIKNKEKIQRKIGRLDERYSGFSKRFDITLIPETENADRIHDLTFKRKPVFNIPEENENPLWGAYVMETPHTDLEAEQIWKLYMTLTQVEAAFRSLKTDLGTRPIFHQSAERTEAHLFISVLAYSVLACIEHRLRQAGDHRQWRTVREQMTTHRRDTIILTDDRGNIHHIRQTGAPEPVHLDIYRKLGITPRMPRFKNLVGKRL
jgi:transposase